MAVKFVSEHLKKYSTIFDLFVYNLFLNQYFQIQ